MLEMVPRRSPYDVLFVFANGMLCSAILDDDGIGLKNANLFRDSFHFVHDIWSKQFSAAWTDGLAMGVCNLLNANSQDD